VAISMITRRQTGAWRADISQMWRFW